VPARVEQRAAPGEARGVRDRDRRWRPPRPPRRAAAGAAAASGRPTARPRRRRRDADAAGRHGERVRLRSVAPPRRSSPSTMSPRPGVPWHHRDAGSPLGSSHSCSSAAISRRRRLGVAKTMRTGLRSHEGAGPRPPPSRAWHTFDVGVGGWWRPRPAAARGPRACRRRTSASGATPGLSTALRSAAEPAQQLGLVPHRDASVPAFSILLPGSSPATIAVVFFDTLPVTAPPACSISRVASSRDSFGERARQDEGMAVEHAAGGHLGRSSSGARVPQPADEGAVAPLPEGTPAPAAAMVGPMPPHLADLLRRASISWSIVPKRRASRSAAPAPTCRMPSAKEQGGQRPVPEAATACTSCAADFSAKPSSATSRSASRPYRRRRPLSVARRATA